MIVSITNQIAFYFVKLLFYEVLFLCLVLLSTNIIVQIFALVNSKMLIFALFVFFTNDLV